MEADFDKLIRVCIERESKPSSVLCGREKEKFDRSLSTQLISEKQPFGKSVQFLRHTRKNSDQHGMICFCIAAILHRINAK